MWVGGWVRVRDVGEGLQTPMGRGRTAVGTHFFSPCPFFSTPCVPLFHPVSPPLHKFFTPNLYLRPKR